LARTGTILSSYTSTSAFSYNNGWYYFPQGVSPSQGEHVGNKYYFKIVAEADGVSGIKNAYQVDISYSGTNGTIPTGVSGVRSFAYSWTVDFPQRRPASTWNIYPYVPENANARDRGTRTTSCS
jgi:hypothetical protein